VYTAIGTVPVRVEGIAGATVGESDLRAVIDGIANPSLGPGWKVRPDGRAPALELIFDRPRAIGRIELVARSLDGNAVRVRLLALDESGRWHPLVTGAKASDVYCTTAREYRFGAGLPKLARIRVELQGEARSHRVELHEISVFERDGTT
jgi:hypothetical protein